jgi:hypothetical protein
MSNACRLIEEKYMLFVKIFYNCEVVDELREITFGGRKGNGFVLRVLRDRN